IGKPLTDLRVTWRGQLKQDVLPWAPVAGSLVECHAAEYLVGFAPTAERDYGAHAKVGTQLLQRIAPQSARSFLACHPAALD
ncbi:TraI domain-containing protein, partial [Klebsiella pneumoniae]